MLPSIIKSIIFSFFIVFFFIVPCSGLTLSESIKIALENNPEVLASREMVKAHEARVGQAFSGFLPQIKLEGELGKEYRTPVSYNIAGTPFTLYPDEAATVVNYGALLSQNIYTGGRLNSQLDIAKVQQAVAREELLRKEQEVAYRTAQAFYDVRAKERMRALSREMLDLATAHLELAKKYCAVGRVPRSDLLRAQVKLAAEAINEIRARNELEVARVRFNEFLGRETGVPVSLDAAAQPEAGGVVPDQQELLATAYDNRPEWKTHRLQRSIGQSEIALARSDYLPSLALNGAISRSMTDYPANALRRDVDAWNIYGVVSWTLFNGMNTQNRVAEAQAGLSATQALEKRVAGRIAADVKTAHLYLGAARQRVEGARQEVIYAEENLKHALQKYRQGVGSNIEYIQAQTSLTEARTDLVQAEADLALARAGINFAVGKEIFTIK